MNDDRHGNLRHKLMALAVSVALLLGTGTTGTALAMESPEANSSSAAQTNEARPSKGRFPRLEATTQAEAVAQADSQAGQPIATAQSDTPMTPEQAKDYPHFGQWGTNMVVKHKAQGESEWQDVDLSQGDSSVDEGDDLYFGLEYTVPEDGLKMADGTTTTTMVFELPKTVKTNAVSGKVMQNNEQVGTYTIAKGLITIDFNDDFAKKNWAEPAGDGQEIDGSLSFEGSVDFNAGDKDDEFEIPVPGGQDHTVIIKNKYDVTVSKRVQSQDNTKGTVTYVVEVSSKYGTKEDVSFKDVMTGPDGNPLQFDGSGAFTVTDEDGQPVQVTAPSDGASEFNLTLPKMDPGDKYIITYTAKLDNLPTDGKTTVNNKASVDSGKDYHDEHSVDTSFEQKPSVSKQGSDPDDNGLRTWTITVNKEQYDIDGYTLSDILGDGMKIEGDVTITPSDGQSFTAILPYTFGSNASDSNTKATYTITYKTSFNGQANNERNTAILTPPNGPDDCTTNPWQDGCSSSGDIWKDGNGLTKTGDIKPVQPDSKTIAMSWSVGIDARNANITAPWKYVDELQQPQNGQHVMLTSLEALKQSVIDAFRAAGITAASDSNIQVAFTYGTGDLTDKAIGFTVSSDTLAIPKGTKVSFNYESQGVLPANVGEWGVNYGNKGTLGGLSTNPSLNYKPEEEVGETTIEKTDVSASGDKTQHDYACGANEDQNNCSPLGVTTNTTRVKHFLSWNIAVQVQSGARVNDVTVIETLPKGLTLLDDTDQGTIKVKNQWGGSESKTITGGLTIASENLQNSDSVAFAGNGSVTVTGADGKSYTLNAAQSDQTIRITLPAAFLQAIGNGTINLGVNAAIDADQFPGSDDKAVQRVYGNTATVQYQVNGKDESKSDSQTQVVDSEELKNVVRKQSSKEDGNEITYWVTINPDAKCLTSENADDATGDDASGNTSGSCAPETLTVKDVLSYSSYGNDPNSGAGIEATLVPGSVKLYGYDESVTKNNSGNAWDSCTLEYVNIPCKGDLLNDKPSYTYDSDHTSAQQYRETLNITVPNKTAMVVEYTYRLSADKLGSNGTINNSASILGKTASKDNQQVEIENSGAHATTFGVSLYKVDADNSGDFLAGAEFELYRYDPDASDSGADGYRKINTAPLISDSNGKVDIHDAKTVEADEPNFNIAYKLVETKAPDGYEIASNDAYYFMVVDDDEERYPVIAPEGFNGNRYHSGDFFYVKNKKTSDVALPETGGVGVSGFVVGGLLAVSVAVGGLSIAMRDVARARRSRGRIS
ncbi:SpaA isopeptide-forming pilin-related protein [Bifidobacterium oedipodis]|uniref:SpaA-like prealbumin fold domain-containing protein n=1 Tax=Bifidobacterium oedipodis TaxID=2675322 RepID=A0A7Y0HUF5_9BIFI|nr:SpaA isopeptide-forming pilin-related protein [Bifidobacterium sp. DSM 109957]NMM95132.1 hypothetical protein [Bifidobacterium sp. DSM 109957]